jgi:hypothetical protein
MATPISKQTKKRFRQGAKTVEKSIKNLRPGRKKSRGRSTVIAGTGVLVAVAAGAAVAAHLRRKEPLDAATFHVDLDGDGGWNLRAEGSADPIETFRTKAMAVRAARKAAAVAAPSELMIHAADGTVQATHSYRPH